MSIKIADSRLANKISLYRVRRTNKVGVLPPYFFALYIDNVVKKDNDSKLGCYMKWVCTSILLYADDILLVAL